MPVGGVRAGHAARRTGRCHSFGCRRGWFVVFRGLRDAPLERLPDTALRDGNRIFAVVRHGHQPHFAARRRSPCRPIQVAVYRAALAAAGVQPETVGVVEAHGTVHRRPD